MDFILNQWINFLHKIIKDQVVQDIIYLEIYLIHRLGYDGDDINLNADNRFIANQKLRMGAYKTKLILFNPFNCEYKIEEQDAYDTEDGTTHAGKQLPIINEKFSGEATRTTYVLKDTGTLYLQEM